MAYRRCVIVGPNGQAQEVILSDEQLGQTSGGSGNYYTAPRFTVKNGQQYMDGKPVYWTGNGWREQ